MSTRNVTLLAGDLHVLQSGGAVCGHGAASVAQALGVIAKGLPALADAQPASARRVYEQLLGNYPADAIGWVLDPSIRWVGPCEVPLDQVDTDDRESWAATHQQDAVRRFARDIKAGTGHTDPVVMVKKPGARRIEVVDGHHRYEACELLRWPCKSYVGFVPRADGPWDETHSSQVHQGSDPANKAAKLTKEIVGYRPADSFSVRCGTCIMYCRRTCTLVAGDIDPADVCDRWEAREAAKSAGNDIRAAGLAVRAADTGRVLMQQRAAGGGSAAGRWEMPGGQLGDGEDPLTAARREWSEETGLDLPDGTLTGAWVSSDGRYLGFVHTIPSEDSLNPGARPDSGEGDYGAALAWWEPKQIRDNPAVRAELSGDHKRIRRALKSAQTPMLEATPDLLGPDGLWHTPDRHVSNPQKLPNYIEHIAHALMGDQRMGESQAIATAINSVRRWAQGDLGWGHGHVTPEVQAASQRALREWDQLRQSHQQGET